MWNRRVQHVREHVGPVSKVDPMEQPTAWPRCRNMDPHVAKTRKRERQLEWSREGRPKPQLAIANQIFAFKDRVSFRATTTTTTIYRSLQSFP